MLLIHELKYLQHGSKFTTKPAICNCVGSYENSNLEDYLYLIPRLFILAMHKAFWGEETFRECT